MRQRREQHSVSKAITKPAQLIDVFMRIHAVHLRDEQCERRAHFKYTFLYLLISVFVLYLFGCHTRVYNAFSGPFHLTLDQFHIHLDKYNQLDLDENLSNSRWFSFHRDYLQIELGENQIEQETKHILNIFSHDPPNGKLLYTFNTVKEIDIVINLLPNKLYVKLASTGENHFHSHLPYRFQSFTIRTLRCIVRQLDVSPNEYIHWIEKSMYVKTIEQIYAQNATAFNMKVIIRCGIVLGYLYRPEGELAYTVNSKSAVKFKKLDVVLDASSPYYPYKTFLFVGLLFSWLFLKAFVYLLVYLFHAIYWPPLRIHPAVEKYLNILQIESLQKLDDLLLRTVDENNYHDRLFLVRDRYLLILNIDWNEYNTCTLYQFYIQEPLTIVPLRDIIRIARDEILVNSGGQMTWYFLPTVRSNADKHGAVWLHEILMYTDATYRYSYEELERLQNEQHSRQQEEENQRRLANLTAEEEQHQLTAYQNNYEAMWNSIIPASPKFIAQFRLTTSRQFDDDLPDISCTICLEGFEYGEYYAQWPCEAKHTFHYDCMLKLLRAQNTCPLCRHAVERSDYAARLLISQYFYRIFI